MQGVGPSPGVGQAVQGEGVEGGAAPLPEGPPLAMGDLSGFAALPAGVGLLGGDVGGGDVCGVPLPGELAGAGGMGPMMAGAPGAGVGGAPAFGAGTAAPGPSSALAMMAQQLEASARKLEAMESAEARAQHPQPQPQPQRHTQPQPQPQRQPQPQPQPQPHQAARPQA